MKFINKISSVSAVLAGLFISITALTNAAFAQSNSPSIKTGVSFQWENAQPNPSDPATLESVTIDGNVFDLFAVPTDYEMTQLGPDGHQHNKIRENGSVAFTNSSSGGWDAAALSAFQDMNLNHYFESSKNGEDICNDFGVIPTTVAQQQSMIYNPGIPVNAGGIVAISERNANNCYHITVYGEPAGGGSVQMLGQTFVNPTSTQWGSTFAPPSGNSDYWLSGRVVENNGTIGIALFQLNDLAPVGSTITKVQLTASTDDHGDGKFFIMQTYAVNESENTIKNSPFNGDAGANDNVPSGSTYSLVSGVNNGTLNFNPDGTYLYTPNAGFTGTDSFIYQVCLPPPNSGTCDQATVTIYVLEGPTANDDSESTTKNTPVDISVLNNDQEGDAPFDLSSIDFVNGTEPDPSTEGTFTVDNTTGIVTFTPAGNFIGTVTIDYEVCDDNSLCDIATITVNVVLGGGNDSDGDGIPDGDDDYPNDPDRAFDNYIPASGYGTLAYEDLWPGKGDYDFNDLVLDFKFQFVTNANNNVLEIFGTFVVRAYGAGFHNGFGFEVITDQIDQSDLSASGYDIQENYIDLNSNGLETGQTNPVFIVYDDAYNVLPHPGEGIGVNTEESAPFVEPDSVVLTINVTPDTYSLSTFMSSTFNPFIIVDGQRGVEVHLPDHPPTDKADMSLFGTHHDDSDPQAGRYYKTQENLPWAINIYESFAYPKEKIEILDAYNYFDNWAESGGQQYPDWYQNNQGYRNADKIYNNQ